MDVHLVWLADWFAGVGTVAAVTVALFKDGLLRWWRSPELTMSIRPSPPDCHKTTYVSADVTADCYYLMLWVENFGKTRAETIQVFIAKLLRKSADGLFQNVNEFLPMNLTWAHGGGVFAAGISPTMGKHCNLGYVIDPKYRKHFGVDVAGVPDDQTILALELEFRPNANSQLIRPGTYQLHLKIAASNCAVVNKTIELTIAGSWFGDERHMFSDGLGVRVQ